MSNAPRHRRPTGLANLIVAATLALALALALAPMLPAHAAERGKVKRADAVAAATVPAASEARVIVKFKPDSSLMRALAAPVRELPARRAKALSSRLGLALTEGRAIGTHAQVLKASGLSSQDLADRLAAQSDVEYAVVDGRKYALGIPNDPLYRDGQPATPASGQWYLRPPSSSAIADARSVVSSINAETAWDVTTGRASVVVAVLDTGVRLDHPDLVGKLRPGYDFVTDPTIAADGSARDADPSDPGDFDTAKGESSSWHGTQTAGLIGAATNNGIGMAGAGRDVTVLPVRVLGQGGGFDSDIQAAMLWAAGIGANPVVNPFPAKVLNLSLGSTGACNAGYANTIAQLNRAGVVVVVAAGNDGLDVGTPANCPGAIAVGGLRHAGSKVGYSDLGPTIAISAPAGNCVNLTGVCEFPLLTTSNSGTTTPVAGAAGATYTSGGVDASFGTSFSAPLVAGTIGLMYSANPTLTPADVLRYLRSTARAFPASGFDPSVPTCTAPTAVAQDSECYCTTSTCGAGMLDAGAAVTAVAQIIAQIVPTATSVTVGSSVTLDGTGSNPGPGATSIVGYQWVVTSGAGLVTAGAANTPTFTLRADSAGTAIVALTVTDNIGRSASTSVSIALNAAPPTTPPADGSSGGGGGGGALSLGWLLGWALGIAGVWAVRPGRRGR